MGVVALILASAALAAAGLAWWVTAFSAGVCIGACLVALREVGA